MAGLTQVQLAQLAGVHVNGIKRLERMDARLGGMTVERIGEGGTRHTCRCLPHALCPHRRLIVPLGRLIAVFNGQSLSQAHNFYGAKTGVTVCEKNFYRISTRAAESCQQYA
jgi:hypothetical protein